MALSSGAAAALTAVSEPRPAEVFITEVGPRDGLQNEKQFIEHSLKIGLVDRLSKAGCFQIEVGSFVSPKWTPQMAGSEAVFAGMKRLEGGRYSALTPNMKGFEAALAAGADEVVIFGAASEAFSQRNINCSIAASLARFEPVAAAAKTHGIRLRAAVSVAFGCPYQGEVPLESVLDVTRRFAEMGCDEIGIADTIGVGTADQVRKLMAACVKLVGADALSGHFHDTYGQAIANIVACLDVGIRRFDASIAGLGGCPYAKGATGNVATEDVVYLLEGLGINTGIDLDQLVDTGQWICEQTGIRPQTRVGNALAAKKRQALS
jgi:hydroxymethylglutaryl-CoA lyase